jgi:hypothetical protein
MRNNNKMVIQEVGCVGMDWFELTQERERWRVFVNVVLKVQLP